MHKRKQRRYTVRIRTCRRCECRMRCWVPVPRPLAALSAAPLVQSISSFSFRLPYKRTHGPRGVLVLSWFWDHSRSSTIPHSDTEFQKPHPSHLLVIASGGTTSATYRPSICRYACCGRDAPAICRGSFFALYYSIGGLYIINKFLKKLALRKLRTISPMGDPSCCLLLYLYCTTRPYLENQTTRRALLCDKACLIGYYSSLWVEKPHQSQTLPQKAYALLGSSSVEKPHQSLIF